MEFPSESLQKFITSVLCPNPLVAPHVPQNKVLGMVFRALHDLPPPPLGHLSHPPDMSRHLWLHPLISSPLILLHLHRSRAIPWLCSDHSHLRLFPPPRMLFPHRLAWLPLTSFRSLLGETFLITPSSIAFPCCPLFLSLFWFFQNHSPSCCYTHM